MSRALLLGLVGAAVAAIGAFLYFFENQVSSFQAPMPEVPTEARLLFVGDMFFDRSIRTTAQEKGYDYLLSCVAERFRSYDAVVANLEGPITDRKSVATGSRVGSWQNYTFTFEPEVAALLARHNVKFVSLGNNHIENMDEAGVVSTRKYLEEAGVAYFGGVSVFEEKSADIAEPVHRTEIQGQALSFVAYNQFGGMPPEDVAPRIRAEKEAGRFVVVLAHWGEEYIPPVKAVRATAKLFADAGAGLIIGAHPHVVQEKGTIGETVVYYSLGNFLFDQFFSDEVQHGLAVEAVFKNGELVSLTDHPTTMLREERQVCFDADLALR